MGLLAPLRWPGVGAWRRAGHDDDVHAALDPDPNTNADTNTDADADIDADAPKNATTPTTTVAIPSIICAMPVTEEAVEQGT